MKAVTLRIAYFSGSVIPSRQANSVHVMKMCQALAKRGHEVVLGAIAGADPGGDDFAHYGVEACFRIVKHTARGRGILARARYALAIPAKMRSVIEPDLVYGRHLLSLSVAARWGAPVVFEAHEAPSPLERAVERRLFARPNFARLVVISGALRDEYRRLHLGLSPQRLLVAHDAADPPPPMSRITDSRRAAGVGRLQVGYVGHLYPGKGMEVVGALAARMPEVDFHVIGGTDEDIAAWRHRTASCENLVYHGHVPPAATEVHRAAMDVLLAPYQERVHAAGAGGEIGRWMSPLKIFEYMASRRPMVASDLPVLREVLCHGETALLASPDDVEEWVAAIERLRDPALRRGIAERAAQRLADCHTWAHRAAQVLEGLPGLDARAQREAAA